MHAYSRFWFQLHPCRPSDGGQNRLERCETVGRVEFQLIRLSYALLRLDVGGKLLTNQLKELVSFRQWNMMDETYIMNHVKETCCFVTQDFKKDLETCR